MTATELDSRPITDTIHARADHRGTLVDTGFRVGERVIVTIGGETFSRIVLGPAAQPHEWPVWDGPQWGRRLVTEAALWICPEGCSDLRRTERISRIERAGMVTA